jgi:hypothetical protein
MPLVLDGGVGKAVEEMRGIRRIEEVMTYLGMCPNCWGKIVSD